MESLTPNLVSVITCDQGDVDATLDCNIKADLCLLLLSYVRTFDVNMLIGNNEDIVRGVLTQHGADAERKLRLL